MFRLLILLFSLFSLIFANPSQQVQKIDGVQYLALHQLDSALGLNGNWDPLRGIYRFEYPQGTPLAIAREHNELFVGGIFLSFNKPVVQKEHSWWVPETMLHLLDSIGEKRVELKNGQIIVSEKSDLRGIEWDPRSNGTLVTLSVKPGTNFDHWFQRPYFILRLNQFEAGEKNPDTTFTRGQIRNLKALKQDKSYQMTFEVNHLVGDVEVIDKSKEGKISLLFRRPEKKDTAPIEKKEPIAKGIKRIVIDPGHGGKDVGAIGVKTNEKTIVLNVGKELKTELKKRGYDVVMTRDDDTFKTLKERPEIASKKGGDLFVSLHANAIDGNKKRKDEVKGYKVYILREAVSEEDKAMARRENQFVEDETDSHGKKELSPVDWIMLEHQLNLYTKESEVFADHIVKSFERNHKKIRKHGTGAGQAGFYVLVGAFMPAVLFEIGFISNPDDEKYMMSKSGRQAIAKHLADAIDTFNKDLIKMNNGQSL